MNSSYQNGVRESGRIVVISFPSDTEIEDSSWNLAGLTLTAYLNRLLSYNALMSLGNFTSFCFDK